MTFMIVLAASAIGSATPAEAAKPERPGSESVCRQEKSTGSRLGSKRVCPTRGEWAQVDAGNKEVADRIVGRTGDRAPNP